MKSIERRISRSVDVLFAFCLFVLALPLMSAIAVAIWLTMGSPVIFRQTRPGLEEKPFQLYKFRTMDAREGDDAIRLTPVGRFLRKISLDELPQLVNVFKGDMALVGPRPLLMEYVPLYLANERIRHSVRPGITGLAQISGRNCLTWEQRVSIDIDYVRNWSLLLDVSILAKTAVSVCLGRGVIEAPDLLTKEFGRRALDAGAAVRVEEL